MREPALVAWAVHILLIPLYVFKSGLPQPGDVFILVLLPVALARWDGKLPRRARTAFRPLLWFTVWVAVVNYTWAFIEGNFTVFGVDAFLLHPLYYTYNALIVLIALVLHRRYNELFVRVTVYAAMATIFIQVLASFALRSAFSRQTVFFNNPNQLGYYALLVATLIALTHRYLRMSLARSAFALTCCAFLAVISASRAAAGGIGILLIVLVFSNPRVILVASLVIVGLVAIGGPIEEALQSSEQRLLNHNAHKLSFWEERGYDRIWEHKEYVLVGAGEGGFSRFATEERIAMEIHSSAGTIVFGYGVVGTLLFLLFVFRVVRGADMRSMLMLIPPLFYTVAHQGLRFTMLWILLAVFVALKREAPTRARIQHPSAFAMS